MVWSCTSIPCEVVYRANFTTTFDLLLAKTKLPLLLVVSFVGWFDYCLYCYELYVNGLLPVFPCERFCFVLGTGNKQRWKILLWPSVRYQFEKTDTCCDENMLLIS